MENKTDYFTVYINIIIIVYHFNNEILLINLANYLHHRIKVQFLLMKTITLQKLFCIV